ncbi:hypothetical protein R1sor_024112 [Riccia sorocarpa]|uniref:Uncharacterized protein n=1 Tax=Riccia sorocarpa TaxID=122646 RepID=A0ABD3GR32_9MARC
MDVKTAAAAIDFMGELATDLDAAAAIDIMGELATDLDASQKKLEKTEREWFCELLETQRESSSSVPCASAQIAGFANWRRRFRRCKQGLINYNVVQKISRTPSASCESDSDCEVRILTESERAGVERQLPEPLRSLEVTSSSDLLVPPPVGTQQSFRRAPRLYSSI